MADVTQTPAIFEVYPELKGKIPWMPLGNLPTPVQKLENLGKQVGAKNLYVKRDDLTSNIYGGNKVRKLEFILAEAKQRGAATLITGGGIGSNFSLATTIHGQRLGMKSILLLMEHPLSEATKRNMLVDYHHQAKMIRVSPKMWKWAIRWQLLLNSFQRPYFIPIGGSNELGSLGFVNAAFELKNQVEAGLMPEPDYLFITAGSLGTLCGLWLGCRLANLKTKVIGVNVSGATTQKAAALINRIVQYIRQSEPEFPEPSVKDADLTILQDFRGERYAQFTKEGKEAILLMHSLEKIKLDGTYTGKTLAGILDYIKRNHLEDKVVLFWNTYNSVDLSQIAASVDYRKLPAAFHKYFEMPNQELDTPL